MTRTVDQDDRASTATFVGIPARAMTLAFVALRVFTGAVWLSNGLAKTFAFAGADWGFFAFGLIDRNAARGIATDAAGRTHLAPLRWFYREVVLAHWGFFEVFLTLAELAIGVGLLLGIASRLAALGGLLLITPIWVMLATARLYLWEYPAEDLFPLLLLALVPAGRVCGLDARLAARFSTRWPF